jgi:hypothetical protein
VLFKTIVLNDSIDITPMLKVIGEKLNNLTKIEETDDDEGEDIIYDNYEEDVEIVK